MSTVLVVDDHKPNRQLIAALLEPRGHYVIQANDGEEALAHIDECVPALVISDILMPRMDGYEFVRRLRSDTRTANVEVLFYTAYYREHEARRLALDLGVVGLLHKPCDPEHLLRTIDLALAANSRPSVATDQERVDREHLRLLTDKLSEQAERLQRANARLSALTELNLQIASERDSTVLLDKVCRGARELLGARYAVIAAREMPEGENVDLYVDGFDDALARRLSPASAAFSQLGGMTSDRKSLRLNGQECESGTLGLPNEHPKVRSLLAAPIVSLGATYGWICATDKVDADRFDAEDERLLTILGAQLGRAHENGRLYRELERHAVQLRAEIVERERNEKRIERLNSVLAVLGGINALAARVRTRTELFREVCRVAVEQGKFKLAWIGSPDEDNAVHATSWAGKTSEIARVMHIPLNDPIARESVVGRAFVERRIAFCKDVSDPSAPVLYRDTLLSHGLRSVAVLPLVVDDETQACLVLYGDAVGQFDETERPLLSELADDLSFALRHVRAEERLDYIAYFDELTGLANRTLFIERATQTVKAAVLTDIRLAVLLVDIDRFKTVNDTFGRRWGDRLLNEFANRLASAVGDTRLVARVGADHFALIMPGVQSERDVLQTLERWIDDSLRQPFAIDGHEHWMTVKTGIAMHPSDGDDADTLLRHAEAALARAKATGESALFYTQKMTAHMTERLTLENRLRRAFENDEFELYYQPKVDLATRSLAGVEALARWRGPGDVLVPPSDFIPLMEETGLILELGAWALGRAARDQSTWREQGLPTPRVAVNVSATQLCRADFVETVERARRQCDGVAELDIEITETLLMEDVGGNIDKIAALRRLGVGVAIDDFGTGYSSLAYLARFPVDTLKIDRHFTSLMLQDEASLALIQTMIALSHSLKLQVVAEGVETEEQAALLSQLGCDVIQGFLIARPMSMEDLAAYLRATQTVPTVS